MKLTVPAVLLACTLAACATHESPPSEAARLHALAEKHFEAELEGDSLFATYAGESQYNDRLVNYLAPGFIERERNRVQRELAVARTIDASRLSPADRITLDVLLYDLEMARAGARFPSHLLPLTHFFSVQNQFPSLGSGRGAQPFDTVADYENWISRVRDFRVLMRQAEANMREGMRRGVVLPRVLVERMIGQLDRHIVDDPTRSLFWMPVANMPGHFTEVDRRRLRNEYAAMIMDVVVPTYRELREFLREDYLPAARDSFGLGALPNGDAWYRYLVRYHTTTNADPEALHELGLARVARNLEEMRKVMRQRGFEGSLGEWFDALRNNEHFYYDTQAALLEDYRAIEARTNAAVSKLFSLRPAADFEVRAIEAYRAKSMPGAFYQSPAPDGSRPGVFYVNTYNLKAQPKFGMETLFMHEAIPGHHFQRGLQVEIKGLPRFRRFGGYSAYTEGWALYAESLGRELGFYDDPMQWYGHLAADQLRAMRLVVDTGLHDKGWTREQAIRYMLDNSSMARSDVVAEVERYMAFPAQALSFKVGQRKIRALRKRAARALGQDFDVREFHRQVLAGGPLPLGVLERKILRWIAAQKNREEQ